MNADKLTPDALQVLMRHKSHQTTWVYINLIVGWMPRPPGRTAREC